MNNHKTTTITLFCVSLNAILQCKLHTSCFPYAGKAHEASGLTQLSTRKHAYNYATRIAKRSASAAPVKRQPVILDTGFYVFPHFFACCPFVSRCLLPPLITFFFCPARFACQTWTDDGDDSKWQQKVRPLLTSEANTNTDMSGKTLFPTALSIP